MRLSLSLKNFIIKVTFAVLFMVPAAALYAQPTLSPHTNYITEFGKMWTFDDLPLDYFKDRYDFMPSQGWIEQLQMSALQFGGGCSGAFISQDGLIMTNHHCGRYGLKTVEKEGEDLFKTGFYADSIGAERKIDGLYVDQLMLINDVTDTVIDAMKKGETNQQKVENRDNKIAELEKMFSEKTHLLCRVVTLYNGAKYSMYCYKRYNDIRVVMSPSFQIASTGWDWDNFTYPRYELDFMFLRAYDETGKPAQITHYFKFNPLGAQPGEPIFCIGRPGDTDRQLSVAELEYYRDVVKPFAFHYYDDIYYVYYDLYQKYPERESTFLDAIMSFGNTRKVFIGQLDGLNNPELMDRKKAFEAKLKAKVQADSTLNNKYGNVWDALEKIFNEKKQYGSKKFVYNLLGWGRSEYLSIASQLVEAAEQMQLPESERAAAYRDDKIDSTLNTIYPEDLDEETNQRLLGVFEGVVYHEFHDDSLLTQQLFNNKHGKEAVDYLLSRSSLSSREKFQELIKKNPVEILNSDDPLIRFIVDNELEKNRISQRLDEIDRTISVLNQELGEVIYKVYGDRIPPDATLTLRLSDGVIAGYEYNGTLAPPKTTYHGMYDRYYSFGEKKYPWGLPERWKTEPENFALKTPLDFASTLDIVGGNSGSSVVNTKGEIVGLVFDGNMESLHGNYLYMPEKNRAVAVDSQGLIEALIHVYKTENLVKEILDGKRP